jgi:hypothetical protein
MNKLNSILLIIIALVQSNCDKSFNEDHLIKEEHCEFLTITGEPSILGKWQVYEKGYSPGHEYIIEKIPSVPAQTVDFKPHNVLVTNILGDYSFYYVLRHPTTGENIIALFTSQQNQEDIKIDELEVSYLLSQCRNGNIRLSFRYCYEGCHLGLKKR